MVSSCTKKLDTVPIDPLVTTSETLFNDPSYYKGFLAKLYASMAVSGQNINFGLLETSAGDQGTTAFLREYWAAQEVTTDECINAWGDGGWWSITVVYGLTKPVRATDVRKNICQYCLLQRIYQGCLQIGSLSGSLKTDVTQYLAEARFLRAYFYYCAMDMYGNVPFATETDLPGTFIQSK